MLSSQRSVEHFGKISFFFIRSFRVRPTHLIFSFYSCSEKDIKPKPQSVAQLRAGTLNLGGFWPKYLSEILYLPTRQFPLRISRFQTVITAINGEKHAPAAKMPLS
jgi:hypothetical protein